MNKSPDIFNLNLRPWTERALMSAAMWPWATKSAWAEVDTALRPRTEELQEKWLSRLDETETNVELLNSSFWRAALVTLL